MQGGEELSSHQNDVVTIGGIRDGGQMSAKDLAVISWALRWP